MFSAREWNDQICILIRLLWLHAGSMHEKYLPHSPLGFPWIVSLNFSLDVTNSFDWILSVATVLNHLNLDTACIWASWPVQYSSPHPKMFRRKLRRPDQFWLLWAELETRIRALDLSSRVLPVTSCCYLKRKYFSLTNGWLTAEKNDGISFSEGH